MSHFYFVAKRSVRLVLCAIESSIVLSIMGASSTGCYSSYVGGISSITIFSLNRLYHRIVQVHHQVLVNGVLIWRFRLGCWWSTLVVAPGLGSPVVSSDPLVLRILWHINILFDGDSRVLDCLVVYRIVTYLSCVLDWRANEFIY